MQFIEWITLVIFYTTSSVLTLENERTVIKITISINTIVLLFNWLVVKCVLDLNKIDILNCILIMSLTIGTYNNLRVISHAFGENIPEKGWEIFYDKKYYEKHKTNLPLKWSIESVNRIN